MVEWNTRFRGVGAVLLLSLGLSACSRSRPTEPITVNWNTQHQTIDGFGASATGYAAGFTPQEADRFFSPQTGIGLSLLRIRPIADRQVTDCDCVANSSPHQCVQGSISQIEAGDLQIAQMATARGVRVVGVPWSPPAVMKSSGQYCSSGTMIGTAANYSTYAGQLADSLVLLRNNGISLDALSVQNEPDTQNERYDTCGWTAKQIHDFIPIFSKAVTEQGFENVKIAAPEQSTWAFDMMSDAMSDPATADTIGIVFGHAYGSENPSGLPSVGSRHVWQTEVGDGQRFDGGIENGLRWARSIHNYMTIGVNAWMYWSLDCGDKYFNHGNNMCLTSQDRVLAKRAYVLGQYAKFVRPGWQRIGVTNDTALLVTSYRGPGKEFAIVAINLRPSAARNQVFALNGFTSVHSMVRPWLTSASSSLAPQNPLSPAANGTAFTYTIPENSVVTFEGKAD